MMMMMMMMSRMVTDRGELEISLLLVYFFILFKLLMGKGLLCRGNNEGTVKGRDDWSLVDKYSPLLGHLYTPFPCILLSRKSPS